jgi:class 3 adenylate cyclase/tetratricopeptide (TPR) repeat protein
MICSNCGTTNESGANFCINCGTPQAATCPACGHGNLPSAHFCASCGTSLPELAPPVQPIGVATGAQKDAAQKSAAVAERRLVSVLFADLVGFTTLSEERDPEEARELLTAYFDVARRAVEGHGGTIEKFIGDAVMAIWGAPVAHEDDAERAVRAALELVAQVPSIADGDIALQARAGVLTGEAAVTLGATGQGMVAGDLVNTASRLQSAAAPGTVLVGEATYRAASTAIAFEPAGDQLLKGKAAPVPAWRATAIVARRGGSGRASILEPPFVGRDDELRLLKDMFEATSRESKSRLVTVVGQAGIGKSRLAWEFEKYLDGVVATVYWHEGRSPAYGEGISYWALAEMVRRRAGIAEGDDDATVRRRLAATLDEFVTDPAELSAIEPRLAGLLGLDELPAEGREELFAAWRTFFERMAAVAPVIMVFSDLQWADQGMLDFVEDLLHWTRAAPIFVVVLARAELLERQRDFGGGGRSVTRINLEPLSEEAMRQLLEGLVPGLPPAAMRSMVKRAEGIPLYAVETVRMLLDRDLLIAEDGGHRLTGELPDLGVAETLQALIASRLDANRPEDRALLLDASVLGQSFTLEALAAVAGAEPEELRERLDRLIRRELLTVEADQRSPERGQYQFVQALVREVAYQNLAKPDRRARHLAAARHLESLGTDELAGVLASHYVSAYHASKPGAEADALAAQARIALQAAAQRAAAVHSHAQAIGHLQEALTVTTDPADRALLHERASESGDLAGGVPKAIEHAERARELYQSLRDAPGALRAATWLGRHQTSSRDEPQAIATLEGALAEAEPIRESPEYAAALAELSRAYMLSQRSDEAVQTADRALQLAGRHRMLRPVVEALINKGTAMIALGRTVESEAVLRGAITIADREGLWAAGLRARNNLLADIDSIDEGYQLTREARDLSVRVGHRRILHQFLIQLVDYSTRAGRWGEGLVEIEAEEGAEALAPVFVTWLAAQRAILAAYRGDIQLADAEAVKMRERAASLDSSSVAASLLLVDSILAYFRGDWSRAIGSARIPSADQNYATDALTMWAHAAVAGNLSDDLHEAIQRLRSAPIQDRLTAAALDAAEGGLAAREGRWDEARGHYRSSLDGLRQIGYRLEEAVTNLEWGMLAGSVDPEAEAAGNAGEAFFVERGAGITVERYRAASVPVDATPPPTTAAAAPATASKTGAPST